MCTGNGRAEHPRSCSSAARSGVDPGAVPPESRRRDPGHDEPGRQSAADATPDGISRGQVLVIAAERDRIAAELHHTVTRRLFTAGLSLHCAAGLLRTATGPAAASASADHIDDAIAILDDTIVDVRAMVDHGRDPARRSDLPGRLRDVVTDMTAVLGFAPSVRLSEALADGVDADLGEDLVVALRETLATVVRGTSARSVAVTIGVDRRSLMLIVVDDGVGQSAAVRQGLLAGLRTRTERRAGALQIDTQDSTGCRTAGIRTVWSVPT